MTSEDLMHPLVPTRGTVQAYERLLAEADMELARAVGITQSRVAPVLKPKSTKTWGIVRIQGRELPTTLTPEQANRVREQLAACAHAIDVDVSSWWAEQSPRAPASAPNNVSPRQLWRTPEGAIALVWAVDHLAGCAVIGHDRHVVSTTKMLHGVAWFCVGVVTERGDIVMVGDGFKRPDTGTVFEVAGIGDGGLVKVEVDGRLFDADANHLTDSASCWRWQSRPTITHCPACGVAHPHSPVHADDCYVAHLRRKAHMAGREANAAAVASDLQRRRFDFALNGVAMHGVVEPRRDEVRLDIAVFADDDPIAIERALRWRRGDEVSSLVLRDGTQFSVLPLELEQTVHKGGAPRLLVKLAIVKPPPTVAAHWTAAMVGSRVASVLKVPAKAVTVVDKPGDLTVFVDAEVELDEARRTIEAEAPLGARISIRRSGMPHLRALAAAVAAVVSSRDWYRRRVDALVSRDAWRYQTFATARRAAVLADVEAGGPCANTHGAVRALLQLLRHYEELRGGGSRPSVAATSFLGDWPEIVVVYERVRQVS